MSRSIYLVFNTETILLALEEIPCGPECYSVRLELTPDCTNLALLTVQRPNCQLFLQLPLLGIEDCLPNSDCSLRRRIDLINNSLTGYQKRIACQCFPCTGPNKLFNAFMMGLVSVILVHGLCFSCYRPFSVNLNGTLIRSINRSNACTFLCGIGNELDPCDTKLVYAYRNFWRVWGGCFDRGDNDQVLDELAEWMNGVDDSSTDCSEVLADTALEDSLGILVSPAKSPRKELGANRCNDLFAEMDQYRILSGEHMYEARIRALERAINELNTSITDLEVKIDRLNANYEDCDERIERVRRDLSERLEIAEESKAQPEDRIHNVERQMAIYAKLLKELSLKVCQ